MAYTVKAPEAIIRGGLQPTYTAAPGTGAGNGFTVVNDGSMVLHIKNVAAGGNCIVTVVTPGTVDGLAITDRTVTIADGEEHFIGPFPPGIYNVGGATGELIQVDFSENTNVTMAALQL